MEDDDSRTFRNYAFISYSHRDIGVARWLQRRLERFRLPSEAHSDSDVNGAGRYLRPVFRDQSDLNSGILADELRKNLEESKFLVLICSRDSAASAWVSAEARAFVEMGRLDRIIPVIIPEGSIPERDLFPEYLREYFAKHPDSEILGVNIGETGPEKALVRVVSRMLGVTFDSLWKRHQRMRRTRMALGAAGLAVAGVLTYLFALPVTVDVTAVMQPSQLRSGSTVTLTVNGAETTVPYSTDAIFGPVRLSGYKRLGKLRIRLKSQFYNDIDTTIKVGWGMHRRVIIDMSRDDTFGVFAGRVYDPDMNPMGGVSVTVGKDSTVTDGDGRFSIAIPLERQRASLPLRLRKAGYAVTGRDDEVPGTDLKLIIRKK